MVSRPSDFGEPSGEAELALSAINLGNAPAGGSAGPITFVDVLPPGAAAVHVSASAAGEAGMFECSISAPRVASCIYDGSLVPYDQIELRIAVDLQAGEAWREGANLFTVGGAGAPAAALERPLVPAGQGGRLGFEEFHLGPEEEGGEVGREAGSHPFQVTAAVSLTQTSQAQPTALPKDLQLRLPTGLVATASAVPRCPIARFYEEDCPQESVVGVGSFAVNEFASPGVRWLVTPIFNLEPSLGEPARFGSLPSKVPVIINSSIRADDYSAELSIGNITEVAGLLGTTVTLWGVPQDPRHDAERGLSCLYAARGVAGYSCGRLEASDPEAMLSMPTACDGPSLRSFATVVPWADRANPISVTDPFVQIVGCNRVPFRPSASARVTSSAASSPSGFALILELPRGPQNWDEVSESALRRVEVTLPEGVTVNPSAASDLLACSPAGFDAEAVDSRGGCPGASQLGEVAIASPISPQPLVGSVYLGGEVGERFTGSLKLYFVARSRALGLLVKFPARLRLDPRNGRITIRADELPQLPFSGLQLTFPQASRALLATPSVCGESTIVTRFTPYSDPAATVESSSPQIIASGPRDGPCQGAGRLFDPTFVAGTRDNAAGSYSPLYLRLSRNDGEADLAGLSLSLPSGLAANLSGVQYCSASALAGATHSGADEEAAPSCPAASRVGRVLVGAGVGPVLAYAPGSLYLAGPDRGAPYSLAALTPALLGPLDLGTTVQRFPIGVDPRTGQLSIDFAKAGRMPSMLQGVALHIRDLRLYLDRSRFTLNPTSCAATAITGSAYAIDGMAAPLDQRFQAADCGTLPFHPSLSLRFAGGLRRSGHPSLRAVVRSGPRQTRLAGISFTLPSGELLDFHHLRELCRRQLPAEACPNGSRLGYARLWSPLLSAPLQGAIYLREPSRGFPDLISELRSGDIRIRLHGRTGASNGRLGLRVEGLPDLPLAKAAISLAGGRRGIFVNSETLCGRKQRVDASVQAQSGKSHRLHPRLHLSGRC
jgi:hypothetical protein